MLWQDDAQTPTAESHSPGIAAKQGELGRYQPASTLIEQREAVDLGQAEEANLEKDTDASVEEQDDDSPSDDDDDSDYLSFDEDNRENVEVSEEERMARERERQMVLEAAGLLIVQSADDPSGPPPPPPPRRVLTRTRSKIAGRGKRQTATDESPEPASEKPVLPPLVTVVEDDQTADVESPAKRRPPPARPVRRRPTRRLSSNKDLPPLPPPTPTVDHATQLDDAYARYEAFRNSQVQQQDSTSNNRLSVISTDSTMTNSSPTTSFTLVSMPDGGSPNRSDAASIASKDDCHHSHRHSRFLNLLRAKTPEPASNEESQGSRRLTISGPMPLGSHIGPPTTLGSPVPASPLLSSTAASVLSLPSVGPSVSSPGDELSPSRNHSPGFGTVCPS